MSRLKVLARTILWRLHLDITRNLKYDRLTLRVMKRLLKADSRCIDVGAHKGEMLELRLRLAPQGEHLAFEPVPYLYRYLHTTFGGKAMIYPFALSEKAGTTTFHHVRNAPAYSGILRRKYDISQPDIEEISVEMRALDEFYPPPPGKRSTSSRLTWREPNSGS